MNKPILYHLLCCCFILLLCSCKKKQPEQVMVANEPTVKYIVVAPEQLETKISALAIDSLNTDFKHKDSIIAFYKLRDYKSAWTNLNQRTALVKAIGDATLEGLSPNDYRFSEIEKISQLDPYGENDNIYIDLLYTDAYLSYANHLANGKVNPKNIHGDWDLEQNNFQYNEILNEAINNNTVTASLELFKPTHKNYQQLKGSLAGIAALVKTDSLKTVLAEGDKLRPDAESERIIDIRKRLNELGYLNDTLVNDSKIYDTLVQKGVKAFQKDKKLITDGIIGNHTIYALNLSYEDQYKSTIANLERWRWYQRNFGEEYIAVNIADYSLTYISPKDTLQFDIIVGKRARKTPVFSSYLKYVEFNPKWFIPPTIKKEDIIPAARKNVEYLRNKSISVFNRDGVRINPDSVEWTGSDPYHFRYVQSSGNHNALGRVKLIFPNRFSVYLHDTNSKKLFKKEYRARSSGCVRVKNPFLLTEKVLHTAKSEWSKTKIDSILEESGTQRVYMKKRVNVHFMYWTVTFDEHTTPRYLNDVYRLDEKVYQALTN